jgi:hypothetical protein
MGKWENGKMGKWENGEMGKWENGKVGPSINTKGTFRNQKSKSPEKISFPRLLLFPSTIRH